MFKDTPNKQTVRRVWDRTILGALVSELSRSLAYFGMPGPEIRDLSDWHDLLSQKTAVQIVRSRRKQKEEDLETIRQIHVNVAVRGLTNFQLLRGSVEDIIISGRDIDGNVPVKIRIGADRTFNLEYDLINLDFEGGAGYRDRGGSKRIEAIRKLFERQRGHSFILLCTVNVRDTLGDEPMEYLLECARRVQNRQVQRVVDWTVELDKGLKEYQLKTWIPLFIKEEAERLQFRCHCYPPVVYEGHERAKMVHFAFSLRHVPGKVLRVASQQSEARVVQLPLLEATGARLKVVEAQHPTFSLSRCAEDLSFLDAGLRRKVLSR